MRGLWDTPGGRMSSGEELHGGTTGRWCVGTPSTLSSQMARTRALAVEGIWWMGPT